MEGIYKTNKKPFCGARWKKVSKRALQFYRDITQKTKRRPYVRSAYFKGEKVFLSLFWRHLHQKKNFRDKTRRLRLLPCALDLIKYSYCRPETKKHIQYLNKKVHRFLGKTKDNSLFCVQIKEDADGSKWFMSVFPFE